MIRSMTGFARVSGPLSERMFVSFTAKSVNHRYLELSVRLPEALWELEQGVRSIASEVLMRGKVDVNVRLQRTAEAEYAVRVNARVANAVIPQIRELLEEQGLPASFTASDLLRVPDLLAVEPLDADLTETEQDAFKALVRELFEKLEQMRAKEGEGLRNDLAARLEEVDRLRQQVEHLRAEVAKEMVEQFRQRVGEIARSVDVQVAEERIAQELVMMAERADVAEELTRMGIHSGQMRALLEGKEAAGKKLDFLSQEVLREINTLGSKSRATAIRTLVIELKSEVERIREQVQNVE